MSKITRCENLYCLLSSVDGRFIEEAYSANIESTRPKVRDKGKFEKRIKIKWATVCSLCLLLVIGVSVFIYSFLGGFITLVERVETKAVKTVFTHIEETQLLLQNNTDNRLIGGDSAYNSQKSADCFNGTRLLLQNNAINRLIGGDLVFNNQNSVEKATAITEKVGVSVGAVNTDFEDGFNENDELQVLKESYDEQANAVFYCKIAVYIYESLPKLESGKVYVSKVENGNGEFKVFIDKLGDYIIMKALFTSENEYTFVNLYVDYDSKNGIFNRYKVQELNSLNNLTVYFENEYISRSLDLNEIGRLYSVKYNTNGEDCYIFQDDKSGTVSFKNKEPNDIVETQRGKKPASEYFEDLKNEIDEEIVKFNGEKCTDFKFSYRLALKYAMGNGDFNVGHKATSSNKQEGIRIPVTFVGFEKEEAEIFWVALDGYVMKPFFPLREGEATYLDENGNEWVLEGYYYDREFKDKIDKDSIPYIGQIEIVVYMKWVLV